MQRQNLAPLAWILGLALALAACVTLEGLALAKPAQTPETDEIRLGRALGTSAAPTPIAVVPCADHEISGGRDTAYQTPVGCWR